MEKKVILGSVYKHYKGGRYLVLHITEESTNARIGNMGVVYVSLTYGKVKHRELSEFIEETEWPDGVRRARFVLED